MITGNLQGLIPVQSSEDVPLFNVQRSGLHLWSVVLGCLHVAGGQDAWEWQHIRLTTYNNDGLSAGPHSAMSATSSKIVDVFALSGIHPEDMLRATANAGTIIYLRLLPVINISSLSYFKPDFGFITVRSRSDQHDNFSLTQP